MKLSIQEANGKLHEGVHVHGCNDRQSLGAGIRRASKDKPLLACVEQKPGHARAYVRTAEADVDERFVDLRRRGDCLSVKEVCHGMSTGDHVGSSPLGC